MKDLNVDLRLKLLEDNIGQKLHSTIFDNNFLDMIPMAQTAKREREKLDFIKMRKYYASKELLTE